MKRRNAVIRGVDDQEALDAELVVVRTEGVQALEIDQCNVSALPSRLWFDLKNLTSLRLSHLSVHFISHHVAELSGLKHLHVNECPNVRAIPDLSGLENLQTLTLPRALSDTYHAMGRDWTTTRLVVSMMRRKFHYGGARSAALLVMLMALRRGWGRDVARLLGRAVYVTRRHGVWARSDKLAYDVERYHCAQPVPWVTLFGPSVLSCACGFSFVEGALPALDDVAGIQRIQRRRARHFQECYNADEQGYCRLESRHFPLHRCVQQVMSRVQHRGDVINEAVVKKQVLELLSSRTNHKVVQVPPHFHQYGSGMRLERQTGVHVIFSAEIDADLTQCVREYLALRKQGALEPRGTGWFGWFIKKYRQQIKSKVYE